MIFSKAQFSTNIGALISKKASFTQGSLLFTVSLLSFTENLQAQYFGKDCSLC